MAGAGVCGLACAWELVRRGVRVTVLDPREPGTGCSQGNAGWVCPSLAGPLPHPRLRRDWPSLIIRRDSPLYIDPRALPSLVGWLWRFRRYCTHADYAAGREATGRLGRDAIALYDRLAEDGVDFEMHDAGVVYALLDGSSRDEHAEDLRALGALGYPDPVLLDRAELLELEPALDERVEAGLWAPAERHVRPESLTAGLAERLFDRGVVFGRGRAMGLVQKGPKAAALEVEGPEGRGRLEGDAFLFATGAWLGGLAARCGTALPIQAGKGYSVTIESPAVPLRHPVYLPERKVGLTPFDGAHRISGTLELSGVNEHLERRRLAALERSAERYVPGITRGATRREWVGMRPLTPDGLPVLGRLPGLENVYVAGGHALLGVTLAPSTGVAIAQLMTGEEPSVDLTPFEPSRFAP